jgi:hypothetical protein
MKFSIKQIVTMNPKVMGVSQDLRFPKGIFQRESSFIEGGIARKPYTKHRVEDQYHKITLDEKNGGFLWNKLEVQVT